MIVCWTLWQREYAYEISVLVYVSISRRFEERNNLVKIKLMFPWFEKDFYQRFSKFYCYFFYISILVLIMDRDPSRQDPWLLSHKVKTFHRASGTVNNQWSQWINKMKKHFFLLLFLFSLFYLFGPPKICWMPSELPTMVLCMQDMYICPLSYLFCSWNWQDLKLFEGIHFSI